MVGKYWLLQLEWPEDVWLWVLFYLYWRKILIIYIYNFTLFKYDATAHLMDYSVNITLYVMD